MVIPSFLVAIATFAVAEAASIFSSTGGLASSSSLERRLDLFTNGFPGMKCNPDAYNTLDSNWNRTYAPSDPQQILISITDDAKNVRFQFATLGQIDHSVVQFWPKGNSAQTTTIRGEDWVFTDGGKNKRKLYLHKLKTETLPPATVYSYKVGSATTADDSAITWSEVYEFHTASTDDSFSFLSTGDVGACNAVSAAHLKAEAKTHNYDFIALAGDQAYDMNDFDGTKGDQYLNFMQNLFANVPYLGAPGNHEAAYDFAHYKNRFNIVPYAESNSHDSSLFYSINYKSLHLVSFSTEVFFKGSNVKGALAWLEADLAKANQNRTERPWIIFITHHPIYCSSIGIAADCTINAGVVRNGWLSSGGVEEILNKHKVDIYVSGHVHNYERTYPVYKNKITSTSYHNAPSLFQLVTGNGGQPEGVASFSAVGGNYPDWSAKRYENFGYTTFKVSPTSIDITHRATNKDGTLGDIVDQVKVTKDPITKA